MSHRHIKGLHKYPLLLLIALIVFASASPAYTDSNIEGHWEGAFGRLGSIQNVRIDIERTDNAYTATYDIPELILYREPVKELTVYPDSLSFRLFWGTFRCQYSPEIGEITGENANWNPKVSIHLKRAMNSNQVQVKPIEFSSGAINLRGDLLLPKGDPPFPAVVVIEGSTTEGRKLWTYRSIGDLLAKNGIAALVYDKRGVGESMGDLDSASFEDLAVDVIAAVDYMSARSDIDRNKIGLFGISQGGWLAPLVSRKSEHVSYIVNLAGPAVSIWQQELDRVEYGMKSGNLGENEPDQFSASELAAALTHTRLAFEVIEDPDLWDEWINSVNSARSTRWANYVMLDSSLSDLQYWLRFKYDPKETLTNTTIPILALFGNDDVLVPLKTNLPLLKSYLAKAGNKSAEIVVFDGVGHDFLTGATLIGNEWLWPKAFWRWNRRAPGLADTIITWIEHQIE